MKHLGQSKFTLSKVMLISGVGLSALLIGIAPVQAAQAAAAPETAARSGNESAERADFDQRIERPGAGSIDAIAGRGTGTRAGCGDCRIQPGRVIHFGSRRGGDRDELCRHKLGGFLP